MNAAASEPGILFDNCGEFEDLAWVPLSMARTRDAAKCVIDEVLERSGFVDGLTENYLRMVVDGRRTWLRPDPERPSPYADEEIWQRCQATDEGAREFWICEARERRISLRRGLDRLRDARRAPDLYRRHRANGRTRRRALAWTWDACLEPHWITNRRFRIRCWFRERRIRREEAEAAKPISIDRLFPGGDR